MIRRTRFPAVLTAVFLALSGCGAERPPQGGVDHLRLGAFAGYNRFGRLRSVTATWSVPRILGGPPAGLAGTWIGAQAPGSEAHAPFIQVGTNEQRVLSGDYYYAFWTDTIRGFHPQHLFEVAAGDRMSVGLTLIGGRWHVSVTDLSSGHWTRFTTTQETSAPFDMADWIQEDVSGSNGRPLPYPDLGLVRFSQLRFNGVAPRASDLYSAWMAVDGRYLAPTPIVEDSFALHDATIDAAGATYLRIARSEDAAQTAFGEAILGWTADTPRARIAELSARFDLQMVQNTHALLAGRWPPTVRPTILRLAAAGLALEAHTRTVTTIPGHGLAAWRAQWFGDTLAVGRNGRLARRQLHIPNSVP